MYDRPLLIWSIAFFKRIQSKGVRATSKAWDRLRYVLFSICSSIHFATSASTEIDNFTIFAVNDQCFYLSYHIYLSYYHTKPTYTYKSYWVIEGWNDRENIDPNAKTVTQSLEAVKSLLTWKRPHGWPHASNVGFVMRRRRPLGAGYVHKKDCYYIRRRLMQLPAATYHRASPAKHQRKHFHKSRSRLLRSLAASARKANGRRREWTSRQDPRRGEGEASSSLSVIDLPHTTRAMWLIIRSKKIRALARGLSMSARIIRGGPPIMNSLSKSQTEDQLRCEILIFFQSVWPLLGLLATSRKSEGEIAPSDNLGTIVLSVI